MAEAADIGANFSSYRGDAGAAGGSFGVVGIDTRPLQDLAAYTVMYNKAKWQQKNAETEATITKLADLSNIALNDLLGKDKEQATKEFAELQKQAAEYARKIPKSPQERIQNELKWQTQYGAFKNNYNSGKKRAVTYVKRRNEIMGGLQDAKQKDAELKILDKEFADTDIATDISASTSFKTGTIDVPAPVPQELNSVSIGDNENVAVSFKIYNPKTNAGAADATVLGIKKLYPQEGTKEFDALSETEKNQARIQGTVESGGKVWVDATEPLNVVLKQYVNADGTFDAIGFENDNASNTTLMNAYNALKRYDTYNREKYQQAQGKMFDSKGLKVQLPANINADDFKVGFVDFAKGVNANQLVQSGMFAKYPGDVFKPVLTETDNEIQRQGLGVQWYNAKTSRINANKPDAASTAATKPQPLFQQPALLFGEHINRLKNHFQKEKNDLVVSFDATDVITRTALGVEEGKFIRYRPDGTAMINTAADGSGGTPLTIEQQKNNFIVAVKGGSKDEAQLDAKFMTDAETGIESIFGTKSGTAIWKNWGTPATPAPAATPEAGTTADDSKLSDAQYFMKYKKARK